MVSAGHVCPSPIRQLCGLFWSHTVPIATTQMMRENATPRFGLPINDYSHFLSHTVSPDLRHLATSTAPSVHLPALAHSTQSHCWPRSHRNRLGLLWNC